MVGATTERERETERKYGGVDLFGVEKSLLARLEGGERLKEKGAEGNSAEVGIHKANTTTTTHSTFHLLVSAGSGSENDPSGCIITYKRIHKHQKPRSCYNA